MMTSMRVSQRTSFASAFQPRVACPRPLRRCCVVVRAEVKQGREFRESDGSMITPVATSKDGTPEPGALFADEIAAQRAASPKAVPNLSPEMKSRLRDEYTGFGGAPNKAMGANYFLYIIVTISVLAVLSKLTGAIP